MKCTVLAVSAVVVATASAAAPAVASPEPADVPGLVRFATFNASLNRATEGELLADLSTPDDEQARKVAEVVQRNRPDVVLLNEFDFVPGGAAVDAFRANYLAVGHNGAQPIDYPYAYTAPVNTGVPSGMDLDNDGRTGGPGDAYGFGQFPGQYGMVVLSKHPIGDVRTFQHFRWTDMPGAMMPDDPATPEPADWYSPQEKQALRLSSKSHWDLPIHVGGRTVHLLASHPTPPSFDGPEDRNGVRNHDEIRFWADYVAGAGYVYDDAGRTGGLERGAPFVIAGDQNADANDGDSADRAATQLLNAQRVIDPLPGSFGAVEAARNQGGANTGHRGAPYFDTADFGDQSPGNLRVDYVLPSLPLVPLRSGVFWPGTHDELSRLNDTSDHHLVWVDVLAAYHD
ncbi:endonuclease/exonuclease/phosphatase family protein [Saccharopolyspora erythraea]|uniref:endonuclease/exonuclease/phosphatase family protein n=1 Tax=Saccharopolyspora erythraea TaxID=1836 RepID=UPI001BAD4E76|nr:endonuclease/exonuclease/phosphatase family protein [Saccharopolyspora erythraea]QUG99570.1 endonuclease/exonuclease/phosphatase family protein [Saccharopolyspora erythraea]